MTDIPDRIEREMMLPVPVERAWAALTEPAEIAKWFGSGAEMDLRPGGDAVFIFGDERCTAIVEAVEPMRRLAYWWKPDSTRRRRVPPSTGSREAPACALSSPASRRSPTRRRSA